jgi:hydroxyethylthiazole kinase-like uncharacterized protein yjeF
MAEPLPLVPAVPISASELRAWLQPRPPGGHKRSFGKLQIVAGSLAYPGAARLCALGAFKAGCGYVCLETEAPIEIVRDLPEIVPGFFDDADAYVVGPGLDPARDGARVRALLARVPADRPLLLDGGALAFATLESVASRGAALVLTPHEAELARLLGKGWDAESVRRDRSRALEAWAGLLPLATRLLKGSPTLIQSGDTALRSMTFGSVAMATAGQGDLLAGVIGAYLALGLEPLVAAALGSSLCALAARDLSTGSASQGVLAHEVAAQLPATVARLIAAEPAAHS